LHTFHLSCKIEAAEARSKTFAQGGGGDKLKVRNFLDHMPRQNERFQFSGQGQIPKTVTFSSATGELWGTMRVDSCQTLSILIVKFMTSNTFKLQAKSKALEEYEKKNKDLGGPNTLTWHV
jgi:hypothetical protein